MLHGLGKFWSGSEEFGGVALRQICSARGWTLKRPRDAEGLVIEPPHPAPWRLEWGNSQRGYIPGKELRLRAYAGFDPDAYGVLMPNQQLCDLEQALFKQSTQGVKTLMDEDLPEEMRWLALAPKLNRAQMGGLHGPFAAVGNGPAWLSEWLSGPLVARLRVFCGIPHGWQDAWPQMPPMALMVKRGELIWRLGMPQLDVGKLLQAVEVFGQAWEQAVPFAVVESRPQSLF